MCGKYGINLRSFCVIFGQDPLGLWYSKLPPWHQQGIYFNIVIIM